MRAMKPAKHLLLLVRRSDFKIIQTASIPHFSKDAANIGSVLFNPRQDSYLLPRLLFPIHSTSFNRSFRQFSTLHSRMILKIHSVIL